MYYDRIDLSKWIDPVKSSNSNECMVCYYWLFIHEFNFQDFVYNGCHDLLMLRLNLSDIVIITLEGDDYCCNILYEQIWSNWFVR